MRAVVQRVKSASVIVNGKEISSIKKGLLVFVGFGKNDNYNDIVYMADKIIGLRIFPDTLKESSLSVKDINGEILLVSQFTLYGDVRKGKRPSFSDALEANKAKEFYEILKNEMEKLNVIVKLGIFQEMMEVNLINDGPYTILLDSKKVF